VSQFARMTALLAVMFLPCISQAAASPQSDRDQGSPFGYERQLKKVMRPVNDLLPQGSQDDLSSGENHL